MGRAPWVAITVSIDPGRRLRPGVPYLYTPQRYAEAVAEAGGVPVLLPPGAPERAALHLARCDALLLSGGDQLPTHFGGDAFAEGVASRPPPRDPEEAERVAWERALLDAAQMRGLPVLGVCYGMQLMNLHYGGSLHPDFLPDAGVHGGSGAVTHHAVEVSETSRLRGWLGARAEVASSHHQAIDRVAERFRVTARAGDAVVEAIEAEAGFLIGVEWHPELDATGAALYGALVDAARGEGAR